MFVPHSRRSRRILAGPAALLAVGLTLSACGTPGGSDEASSSDTATEAPETTETATEESPESTETAQAEITCDSGTLVVADYEGPGSGETIDKLIESFMAENPGVTVERQFTAFPDYVKNIKLTLSADSAPDVVEVGQGHTMQAPLVEAGLLLPLDDYAAAFGWNDLYPGVLIDQNRVEDGGKTFGTGKQYALPLGGNIIGVFYNGQLLEEIGGTAPPATLAEFEALLEQAKEAGIQPIVLGDLGAGGAAGHVAGTIISMLAPREAVRGWIFGQDGATVDTPEMKQAFETFKSWVDNGYINDDWAGLAYPDMGTRFTDGEALFLIAGNWMQPANDEALGTDSGFFLLPGDEAGEAPAAPGAGAGVFGISAKSKNPDCAAVFIDYMANGQQAEVLATGGFLPIATGGYTPPTTGASLDSVIAEFNRSNENDGMNLFLDWATPSMGSTYFPALQEYLAGRISVDELVQKMQEDWTQFYSE